MKKKLLFSLRKVQKQKAACAASPALLHTQEWDYKKVLGKGSINKKVAAGWWEGGLHSTLTFMVISYRVLSKSNFL